MSQVPWTGPGLREDSSIRDILIKEPSSTGYVEKQISEVYCLPWFCLDCQATLCQVVQALDCAIASGQKLPISCLYCKSIFEPSLATKATLSSEKAARELHTMVAFVAAALLSHDKSTGVITAVARLIHHVLTCLLGNHVTIFVNNAVSVVPQ
jgi:hypothetical protein